MSGEGQFFRGGEDAHAHAPLALGSFVAWDDEGGFREVHLPCQRLHLCIVQAAGIGKDGELVALKRDGGKHIELDKREPAFLV